MWVGQGSNIIQVVRSGYLEEVTFELRLGKQDMASRATTGGGTFQAEDTMISAKALGQEHTWCMWRLETWLVRQKGGRWEKETKGKLWCRDGSHPLLRAIGTQPFPSGCVGW